MLVLFGMKTYELPSAMAKLSDFTIANVILDSDCCNAPFPSKPFSSQPPDRVVSSSYISGLCDANGLYDDNTGLIDSRVTKEY